MSTELPIVLITPEAKATLESEAERAGFVGDVVGGLLFGYPLDDRRRLVIGSIKPSRETHFGEKEFSLRRSRTSRQLDEARELSKEAHYCGVWFVHHTPTGELSDDEWTQAQSILEDPDYRFEDLVCLVICLYAGKLNMYALSFNLNHSARGQLPAPTVLKLTTDEAPQRPAAARDAVPSKGTKWYKDPQAGRRLQLEHDRLAQRYRVESALLPDGRVVFRLMPKGEHEDMVFYLACHPGFPNQAPTAFLSIRGDRYPLLSPGLSEWSPDRWLVEVADDLIEWQVGLLDQQMTAAEEALERGAFKEASDLLAMILLIDPRKPGAARLLAQAQGGLEKE